MEWLDTHAGSVQAIATLVLVGLTGYYAWASRALVRETFKISRVGVIAGCYVTQGNIKRNAKVRVIREGVVIYPPVDRTAGLESLKRFKGDVGEVREGFECGIKLAGYDDIKVGDVIEAFRVEQVQRTLD